MLSTMGNTNTRSEDLFQEYDGSTNATTINRGTYGMPKPQLRFHQVCGTNIQLLKDMRVARRRESFCKGLAFSNRPVSIDEIICLKLVEVGTNWSGVMRFGVTNVDPASFRDIELPKFACPDLTSKGGYWAKSLSERYSVENSILHFFVNRNGEMHYGINGVNKGIFITGINTILPMWIILDIYGNSIGLEFLDPSEIPNLPSPRVLRRAETQQTPQDVQVGGRSRISDSTEDLLHPSTAQSSIGSQRPVSSGIASSNSSSANNLYSMGANTSRFSSARNSPNTTTSNHNTGSKMRFHSVKGANVTLQNDDTAAIRKRGEYSLGYVFTESPIKIDEKLVILIGMFEEAFSGGLAFGLTSCDPIQVPASRLPADSDELLERPEYWICIKDVGASPQVGDKLSFRVDSQGRVFFSKNDSPERAIFHVDVSVSLWAFFDLYGSTRKIQILDHPIHSLSGFDLARGYRASSEGCGSGGVISDSATTSSNRHSAPWTGACSLRVALPTECCGNSALPVPATTATLSSRLSPASAPNPTLEPSDFGRLRVELATRLRNRRMYPEGRERDRDESLERRANLSTGSSQNTNEESSAGLSRSPRSELPTVAEILAARRRMVSVTSNSPLTPVTLSSSPRESRVVNRATTFAEISESSNSAFAPASITVPTVPLPLGTSLLISNDEEQNKRNRVAEVHLQGHVDDQDDEGGDIVPKTDSECSICMNNRVNAVIYKCGHMCMCFTCAKETRRRSGDCPICRSPIIDVIRCYPS